MITNMNPWEYTPPGESGALQYLTVAVTTNCNFNCTFCSKKDLNQLDIDAKLLRTILVEASGLGLEKVEFTGGEPLLFPGLLDLIDELHARGITSLVVTNGSAIDESTAGRLARAGAMVAVSLSTLNKKKFDRLTGTRGNFPRVIEGIRLLREAGFNSDNVPLVALQSIVSRENLDELPFLKIWGEAQGCRFILNRPIPVGAMGYKSLIDGDDLKKLLDPGAKVPFSLDSPCNRLVVGCYIGSDAVVRPCPCIDIPAGSLHEEKLSVIWNDSPVIAKSRIINYSLKGSCGQCEERMRCYGCRAVAYAVFKDITAPDPGCFRYKGNWKPGGEMK